MGFEAGGGNGESVGSCMASIEGVGDGGTKMDGDWICKGVASCGGSEGVGAEGAGAGGGSDFGTHVEGP